MLARQCLVADSPTVVHGRQLTIPFTTKIAKAMKDTKKPWKRGLFLRALRVPGGR